MRRRWRDTSPAVADAAAAFLAHARESGCAVAPGAGIVPPAPDTSTLFVTATIQVWREWVLGTAPPERRAGLQWCVRMRALEQVGDSPYLTSFLMAGEAAAGPVPRAEVFARVHALLGGRLGLPVERLVYVLGDRPADTASAAALRALGVAQERIVMRPRAWARPFKPGPTGPSVFVRLDGAQVWHLVFLERDGVRPVVDGAASVEWLEAAASGSFDVYETSTLREPRRRWRAAVGDERAARVLADHCRTIALLTGSGIQPSGRGHGQVLRRLVSRACAALDAHAADRALLLEGVAAAAAACRGVAGFPAALDLDALATELDAYGRRVEELRRRYRRRIGRCRSAPETARLVFELKGSGAPLELISGWLRADGVALPAAELERLRGAERERSRAG